MVFLLLSLLEAIKFRLVSCEDENRKIGIYYDRPSRGTALAKIEFLTPFTSTANLLDSYSTSRELSMLKNVQSSNTKIPYGVLIILVEDPRKLLK